MKTKTFLIILIFAMAVISGCSTGRALLTDEMDTEAELRNHLADEIEYREFLDEERKAELTEGAVDIWKQAQEARRVFDEFDLREWVRQQLLK